MAFSVDKKNDFGNDSIKSNFYKRLSSDANPFIKVLDTLEQIHKHTYKKHDEKEVREAYKNTIEYQSEFTNSDLLLFDTIFYPLVNRVLENLKIANPEYDLFNHVLISKSRVPNAYCYGNGIIVVNLGMLSLLQNEDQLAALLGHEFAHHHLKHMERRILHKKEFDDAKSNKKRLRNISRSEYEQMARLEQFHLESAMYERTKQRSFETEADLMAVKMLENSTYHSSGVIELLEILDNCDKEKYQVNLDYHSIFSNGNYFFDRRLLLNKEGLEVKELEDETLVEALKTHPDCDDRIAVVKSDYGIEKRSEVKKEQFYLNNGQLSDYELLFQDIENRRYALCLQQALVLKQAVKDHPFLEVIVANCLAEIYFAQKDHMLWDYLPLPHEELPLNYHQLLVIIENIRLSELKKLSLSYIRKVKQEVKPRLSDNEGYLAYLELQEKCIKENRLPNEKEVGKLKGKYPLNSFINY